MPIVRPNGYTEWYDKWATLVCSFQILAPALMFTSRAVVRPDLVIWRGGGAKNPSSGTDSYNLHHLYIIPSSDWIPLGSTLGGDSRFNKGTPQPVYQVVYSRVGEYGQVAYFTMYTIRETSGFFLDYELRNSAWPLPNQIKLQQPYCCWHLWQATCQTVKMVFFLMANAGIGSPTP